jgi:single-stranded-DNA-specific exonuclease
VRELRVDLDLPLAEATDDLERLLRHLEPFGPGNPGPMFLAEGVRVSSRARRIGTDGVKLVVEAGERRLDAVGWGMAERAGELGEGAMLDIVYKLERNEYRGRTSLQLGLADFRTAR